MLQAEAIAAGYEDGHSSPNTHDFEGEEESEHIPLQGEDRSASSATAEDLISELGDEENLKFLHLSFPKQSITTLKFVLAKSHDDVLKAIDDLLNRQLIDEEKEFDAILDGDGSGVGGAVDDFYNQYSNVSSKSHRKRHRHQQRHQQQQVELPSELDTTKKTSRWEQISSEVDWLTRVLSIPRSTVQSTYHTHHSSLPASLNALLESTKWEDSSTSPDHDDNYTRLIKSFPGLGSNRINDILSATKEQLPLATEVANVLSAWRPTIGSITSDLAKTSIAAPSATSEAPVVYDDKFTAAEGRNLAAEYAGKRNTAFRQAAAAYQRSKSDGLMGGTAMYYSQLGRDFDRQMRAYNMRAAQLSSTQKSGSSDDLDLHGLSVHEGLVVVAEGVTRWYASTRMLETGQLVRPLRIVTGVGRHSPGGEARLLPAVQKYLDREGWQNQTTGGGGMILVTGLVKKSKWHNAGEIC